MAARPMYLRPGSRGMIMFTAGIPMTMDRIRPAIRSMRRCAAIRPCSRTTSISIGMAGGMPHTHWHDHFPETAHPVATSTKTEAPLHQHRHKTSGRTALLLILGSSPMVEGIPAFFAAGKYGVGLIMVMAFVFAISTIATYVLLCVYSTARLQRVRLGAFERYGEVLSGAFIALVGLAFWIWPVL